MVPTRKIGIVTVARSDYGIYRPILRAIEQDPGLELQLFVGGTHLARRFGQTVNEITEDGFVPAALIHSILDAEEPNAISKSLGLQITGFADALTQHRPDILLVLGDRFEMLAAAFASQPFNLPLAHIHGGELSLGAIDDAMRHAITKLSHVHFPTTEEHANRIRQLGEADERIFCCGAPGLDNICNDDFADIDLGAFLGMPPEEIEAPLLITFHAETRSNLSGTAQIRPLLSVLENAAETLLFTMPNNDPGGMEIMAAISNFCAGRERAILIDNLGSRRYCKAMSIAKAMLGNSSSGIIEAASFGLPVLNIGDRQLGRAHGENVIHAENTIEAVGRGLDTVLQASAEQRFVGMTNIYGDGTAASRIVEVLKTLELGEALLKKDFVDRPGIVR